MPAKLEARLTAFVVLACVVAASGGLLFGYDGGVTGGTLSMEGFQRDFFPSTLNPPPETDPYCKYNLKLLQLYASLMHFTGSVASIPAGFFTRSHGRTRAMALAGTSFLSGCVFLAAAQGSQFWMIMVGRVFWGVGVGFADQSVTIYNAEVAPPQWRGALNSLFQLCTVTGILIAQAINIGTIKNVPWGWRLSLGLAAVPGTLLLLGGLFLPESPNSLIQRGQQERGKRVLQRLRGTHNVDYEFNTIVEAEEAEMHLAENPWRAIFRKRNRAQLTLAMAMPFFQQWTGINAVIFFSPQLFAGVGSLGSGASGALVASVIIGAVQVVGTIFGIAMVDRVGRRTLLLFASAQGAVAEFGLAILFAQGFHAGVTNFSQGASIGAILLVCVFVFAFGYGGGPLGWLVPSEVQPLGTRSAGQSITVTTQLLSGAIVGQSFLNMLCSMKYGVFIFFGAFHAMAFVFCWFLLPETRGLPIEEVADHVRAHWFWRRVTG
ncbi:hypothetical protein WJX72_010227 [[Myrmecia] bisecta]|uniref:Major facilitator superfamily (MFS) profile domain-containing protein n=1 Tax=[Myrmecia] bisecta TaxID=41462 RepID=A0AAW1PDC0_9CHLO